MKNKINIFNSSQYLIVFIFIACLFLPFYIMIVTSLKNEIQIVNSFWSIAPPYRWGNYVKAWNVVNIYFVNSFFVTITTVLGVLLVSIPAGYAFSKLRFKYKEPLFYTLMSFKMIPTTLLLIPMFMNILKLGLDNNHWGVILPNVASGAVVAIVLVRSFFEVIPNSIFESAKIEGANEYTIMTRMVIPLSAPVIGTVAVFNFFGTFNQYMWPYIILSDDKLKTIPIGLAKLAGQYGVNFGLQMAGYVIASVPLVILFILTANLYIGGITEGAVK